MAAQTSQFGAAEKDQIFQLTPKQGSSTQKNKEEHIVLNIAEVANKKIMLRKQGAQFQFTGNPVIDFYRRVNEFFVDHTAIKVREKAVMFRLLAVMLNAGLPLIRSLNTLAVQSEKNPRLAKVLFGMAHAIENGSSLSEAMAENADVFNEAQIGMVKAGEASGQLNTTLRGVAEELEKNASITGKVKGALIYPVVILTLLAVAVFLMMVMVIPQITKLFTQLSQELPLPTQILIGVSEFSVTWWPFIIMAVLGVILFISLWRKTRAGRYSIDYFKLILPIFGQLFKKAALSRFARSFSNLLGSGVPIIKSLEIVAHAIGNEVYKRRLMLTAEDMKRGIPIAENLAESPLFPAMLVNMIEVGEQTAQLENVTLKVAEFYDEEVNTTVNALTKTLEPLILVIIGVVVGGLVAAIMLPIMQLTNVAGGF